MTSHSSRASEHPARGLSTHSARGGRRGDPVTDRRAFLGAAGAMAAVGAGATAASSAGRVNSMPVIVFPSPQPYPQGALGSTGQAMLLVHHTFGANEPDGDVSLLLSGAVFLDASLEEVAPGAADASAWFVAKAGTNPVLGRPVLDVVELTEEDGAQLFEVTYKSAAAPAGAEFVLGRLSLQYGCPGGGNRNKLCVGEAKDAQKARLADGSTDGILLYARRNGEARLLRMRAAARNVDDAWEDDD